LLELETFVTCAVEGTFSGAADRLGVSRPGISKRIAHLEALAGKSLFDRQGRGVRLTDAGARLLAGARRILEERDLLVGVLAEIRQGGPSPIAGLRELLGRPQESVRAAQLAEARLVETERILEAVLRASATGVAISDPDSSVIHEVNDAYCRFVGRSRIELVGKPASETGLWSDIGERAGLIEELRRTGSLDRVLIRVRRPDSSIVAGETSVRLISVAGHPKMLSTVDDVTEQRQLALRHDGALIAYQAIAAIGEHVLAGEPLLQSVAATLPELRRSGAFVTALLWDPDGVTPTHLDGDAPWPTLAEDLDRSRPLPGAATTLLVRSGADHGQAIGFALGLPELERTVILLSRENRAESTRALVAAVLGDLHKIVRSLAALASSAGLSAGE
jgi:PAS domain S-box-containing protein